MAEQFGEYELLQKIATGGMAEIHLARVGGVEGFSRRVVVKRMLPQLAVREDFVNMFLDEARLAANLIHPNIVQVFNLGEVDGSYFMAMELIDGPHLGALFAHSLRQRRPLPIELCVYMVARAADGLDFAHNHIDPGTGKPLNVVHRDISPQNLLVSRHGDVKVTDFGVAKAETQKAKTRTGIIKGKVSYMSPEQCLGETVDRRTDVFALGVVLYELLTRRRLYREKSDLLVMQRITAEDVRPPSEVNPGVDMELDEISLRALAKDADHRFPSAAELSETLDVWLATQGHADCRAQLQRWMDAHGEGLGVGAGPVEESIGSIPAQPNPEATAAQMEHADMEDAGGTVSTPVLDPAHSGMSDKFPRLDEDNALAQTERLAEAGVTLNGDRRHSIPSDTQVIDVSSHPDQAILSVQDLGPPAAYGHDTIPPPSELQLPSDSLLEVERAAKPLPIAALAGGLMAFLIAAGAGAFLLLSPGTVEPPDDGLKAPIVEVVATRVDSDATRAGTAADTPAAPEAAKLSVLTEPDGAVVLIDGKPDGNAPREIGFELTENKTVRVSAIFPDQAPVTEDVTLSPGGEYAVRLLARARITVKTTPPGGSVMLDGKPMGPTPRTDMMVVPGAEHLVAVSLAGYAAWQEAVTPEPGQRIVLEPTLDKTASQPKPKPKPKPRTGRRPPAVETGEGVLIVNSAPWGIVYIDGRRRGPTPLRLPRVRAGKHRVKIVNKDFGFTKEVKVDVKKDDKTSVGFRFEKKGSGYVFSRLIR